MLIIHILYISTCKYLYKTFNFKKINVKNMLVVQYVNTYIYLTSTCFLYVEADTTIYLAGD